MTFELGQTVRTRLRSAPGHTRLPIYARGRYGVIHSLRGHFPFADDLARTGHASREAQYSVRFRARDLWGAEAGEHDVYLDMFESYLMPADDEEDKA